MEQFIFCYCNYCCRSHLSEVPNVEELYDSLMNLILQLGNHGVIHGDFNEFNILLTKETYQPIIIDFPQMVSIHHPNAEQYVHLFLWLLDTLYSYS